jgi:hypothetical protein
LLTASVAKFKIILPVFTPSFSSGSEATKIAIQVKAGRTCDILSKEMNER